MALETYADENFFEMSYFPDLDDPKS